MDTRFNEIAAVIGDPTRATILWTLMEGRAFTATELALEAETSPQNISMHLHKLVQAGLLSVESQGRHKYYRFSRKEIAYALEGMTLLLPRPDQTRQRHDEPDQPIRQCRTCYDHLAGKLGVGVTESLLKQKIISLKDQEPVLTRRGMKWFSDLGIEPRALMEQRRSFLRTCLDWSERKHHIAGSLAAALLNHMLAGDWLRRTGGSRALVVTSRGRKEFYEHFRITI